MALILKDKVQETSTSYTTSSFTLDGAVTGFQSFSVIGNANTTYYSAFDSSGNWEVGIGTYSSSTLSRTTILSSSNAGSVVTFSGTVNVFCTYPSERALYLDGTSANINVSQAAFTTNGIPYASSTSALATGSALTFNGNTLAIVNEANFTDAVANSRLRVGYGAISGSNGGYINNVDNTPLAFSTTNTERMRIDSSGRVGIGGTPAAGRNLTVEKTITGAVGSYAQLNGGVVQSDVTTAAYYFSSFASTANANFALGQITHYATGGPSTFSNVTAGGSVASQFGFAAESNLTGATNNYGFYGNIASGTNRWNLYMQGTANNYLAGRLGIGSTGLTDRVVSIGNAITGATSSLGVAIISTVSSDVTSSARIYYSSPSTQAASFTLPALQHFYANQATIGVGSIINNQYGYLAESTLTGATSNFGFFGNIAAPTSGIANTGTISSISSSGTTVTVNHNAITYTNGQTVTVTATANATALVSGATCTILTVGTTDFTAIGAASNTVGVSFTATGVGTGDGTVRLNVQGSGKTVAGAASGSFTFTTTTNQTFAAVTVTGSVTVSARYNLYMSGTAPNYFGGDMQFNKTVTATGTTGAQTINKNAGTVNFAAAAASVVVTNSLVTTSSIIICTVGTNDTTMKSVQAVAAAGSFTLYPSAAPTAETRVNFIVIN